MASIKPFKLSIPDSQLDTLKAKLSCTTFPNELSGAGWTMGAPLRDIKRLASHWQSHFSWRKAEAYLNSFPQYTVPISVSGFETLDIHFIHARSERANAIPLLFIHGWPGSYMEVLKLLPLLTDSSDPTIPSFHVVAPSLPNFTWSQGPSKKGFGLTQYAQTLHSVMTALEYTEYVVQGGDWGGFLSRLLAHLYPRNIKAVHTNFPVHTFPKPWRNPLVFVQALAGIAFSSGIRAGLAHTQKYLTEGDGYLKQQDTKPATLGFGLADSPVAVLAWIYEKLHDWSDGYAWTDDEVCMWVSMYVFSREGPAASTRIYYESQHPLDGALSRTQIIEKYIPNVPLALAYFPAEIVSLPLCWAWTNGPVVQQTVFKAGGHFAAWEVPELLAADLRKLFGERGACLGVIQGKQGF